MASKGTREPPDKRDGGGGDAATDTGRGPSKLRSCCFWVCVPVVVLLAAAGVAMYLDYRRWERREAGMLALGSDGLSLFLAYDSNEDGYLSMDEFHPLVDRIVGNQLPCPVHLNRCPVRSEAANGGFAYPMRRSKHFAFSACGCAPYRPLAESTGNATSSDKALPGGRLPCGLAVAMP
ncbi:skeletal muscle fiber development [Branchiostoma belcheri]|nr:skeletal muscle fiber development [Branchiostoma belcheri]